MRNWIKEQLARAAKEMSEEMKGMAKHGAHEVAAMLYTGSGFVMYPRGGSRDDPQVKPVEQEQSQQMDRDI